MLVGADALFVSAGVRLPQKPAKDKLIIVIPRSIKPSVSQAIQAAERDYQADEEIFLWSGRFSESESGNLGNLVPPKLRCGLLSPWNIH